MSSTPSRSADCGDSASRRCSLPAWNDHRQQVPGTLEDASREAVRLLEAHPELIVVENYSSTPVACGRCRAHGAFRPAPLETIVQILGYC